MSRPPLPKLKIDTLYLRAQEALVICQCLIELDHPQLPTPLNSDNVMVHRILTSTIKQKFSKAIDIWFYWSKDCTTQGRFKIFWEPRKHNLAEHPTKHHSSAAHHTRAVQLIYLYDADKSPQTIIGGDKILSHDSRNLGLTKPIPLSQ